MRQSKKKLLRFLRFSLTCIQCHAAVNFFSGTWRVLWYDTHLPHPAVTGMFSPRPQRFALLVPPPAKDPYEAHLPLSLPLTATEVSPSLKRLPTEAGVQKNVTFLVDFNPSRTVSFHGKYGIRCGTCSDPPSKVFCCWGKLRSNRAFWHMTEGSRPNFQYVIGRLMRIQRSLSKHA